MKSNKFLGMSRVNMQKAVYETLELEMKNKIHALSLKLSS
jgi:stress-induced morphogen